MAIKKACTVSESIRNTGKECDKAMGPTAQFFAVPPGTNFTLAEISDIDFINGKLQAASQSRWFPIFGNKAPIRTITPSQEQDIIITLDDGSQTFLRYGFYNTTYETTSGGLCYANALQSLNQSGYGLIEVDKQGQLLVHDNGDATYSALVTDFMYSPAPIRADLKNTPYKNRFMVSFNPEEMVQNGVVLAGGSFLLNVMGLIDAEVTPGTVGTQSTTHLFIKVKTECADTDLIALLGGDLAAVDNFVITKDDGTVITPSAAAIVNGEIQLTGVYVSSTNYNVSLVDAPTLFDNGIIGYEGVSAAVISF